MPIFARILLAAGCLFALQWFPFTGIYLMYMGAGTVTGAVLLLSLLALFVESLTRRVPRWLVGLPIAAVIGYYGLLVYERSILLSLPASVGIEPVSAKLVFDPEQHAIDQPGIDPNYLLARYQVPSVYSSLSSKIRTIGETRSCERNEPYIAGTLLVGSVRPLRETFCFSLRDAPAPAAGLITFKNRNTMPVISGVEAAVMTLSAYLDGTEIGSVSTMSARVLPLLPSLFAGCGLISSTPSWACAVSLRRETVSVWPTSELSADYEREAVLTDQVAKLLSIRLRPDDEISTLSRRRTP